MASAPATAGRLRVRLPSSERGWGALYGRSIDDARNAPHALVPKPAHCSQSWLKSRILATAGHWWGVWLDSPSRASGPHGSWLLSTRSRLGHTAWGGAESPQGSLAKTPVMAIVCRGKPWHPLSRHSRSTSLWPCWSQSPGLRTAWHQLGRKKRPPASPLGEPGASCVTRLA